MSKLFNILRAEVTRVIISAIIVIHLLNYSIDYRNTCDRNGGSTIDEIESIAELMCEEILEMSYIFSDVEETGSDKNNSEPSGFKILYLASCSLITNRQSAILTVQIKGSSNSPTFSLWIFEIKTPPPEYFS